MGILNPRWSSPPHSLRVDEIYRVGGAQAVAALAYGTATIAPVAKIVGPGNAWVAAAKRRVFGQVGIRHDRRPSEVLILADGEANPDWIAADLLAQAEHDTAAQAVLITDQRRTRGFRGERPCEGERSLPSPAPRSPGRAGAITGRSCACATSTRRFPSCDRIALPSTRNRDEGRGGPVPQGPQRGCDIPRLAHARGDRRLRRRPESRPSDRPLRPFLLGLGVLDFMKRTTVIACTPESLRALGPAAITLGRSEGLEGHARSVAIRLNL